MSEAKEQFEGWAILELMGHRKMAGKVSEAVVGGASFIRIDVPARTTGKQLAWAATQFYSPSSVYCITPTTEDLARRFAENQQPQPVSRWELPEPRRVEATDADATPFAVAGTNKCAAAGCETKVRGGSLCEYHAANGDGDGASFEQMGDEQVEL